MSNVNIYHLFQILDTHSSPRAAMGSEVEATLAQAGYLQLLNRWKDFCHYYCLISSHIEIINKEGAELSRYVFVEGFEEVHC